MVATIVVLRPNTGLSKHSDPVFAFQSNRERGLQLCAGCRKGPCGCQSVGVAAIPCAPVFWGVCWPVGHPFVVMKG